MGFESLAGAGGLGPVEINVIMLGGSQISTIVFHALTEQLDAGVVRLLDAVVVTKTTSGSVTVDEVDRAEFALADAALATPGLIGDDDVADLLAGIPDGEAAAIVAFELVWARELAAALNEDGSSVIAVERIPAHVVNAVAEMAAAE
ncbi:DUF6325 family protein [Gordonia sp. HY002]|uniref:DUF6325 family protein n=1 Tax=Gordonia zhenghanii TaxID=2911516 RepID=UPI001EF08EEE|nr:DUF6325 family protein [Gordonia zhenghanii]MCF8571038.1 DUF6325 family protein [Gordonia zhenghanii]MCF8606382.1 DUF6325 family protein [Gordonia zhenghanii]